MKRLIRGKIVVLALVATLSAQGDHAGPQSIPVHDLAINRRAIDVMVTLAEKYHVVIGVYGVFLGTNVKKVDILVKDGTLGDVFDAIVKADTRFEWKQTSNDAIHFTHRDSPLSLLDITVNSFDAENPRRLQTSDLMTQIPEVAAWLRSHGCIMHELIAGPVPREWADFAVHAKKTPFSAVLDEIAARSGTYFWAAVQYRSEPCAINVSP